MINKKFFLYELKRLWILILVISCLLLLFTYLMTFLSGGSIRPLTIITKGSNSWSSTSYGGLAQILQFGFYKGVGLFFFVIYVLISITTVFVVDREKGYISSWLTTPMSRTTIFVTKILVTIGGFLILCFWLVISQLLVFGITMKDFKESIDRILLSDLSFFMVCFLLFAVILIIAISVDKMSIYLLITIALCFWFYIAALLGDIAYSESAKNSPTLLKLKFFRYLSLFSLIRDALAVENSPFFYSFSSEVVERIEKFSDFKKIKLSDFVWQIPLSFILGNSLLVGAEFIFKNKNINV